MPFKAPMKSGHRSGSPPVRLTVRGEPGSTSAIQHATWNGVAHESSRRVPRSAAMRARSCACRVQEPGVSHHRQRRGHPRKRTNVCASPAKAPSPWMDAKTSSTGAATRERESPRVDPDLVDSAAVDSALIESAPVDSAPVESAPVDAARAGSVLFDEALFHSLLEPALGRSDMIGSRAKK